MQVNQFLIVISAMILHLSRHLETIYSETLNALKYLQNLMHTKGTHITFYVAESFLLNQLT